MYDAILVPTDGSDHAVRAADHAVALATAFDATVHVLNVVDVAAAGGPFDIGGAREEFVGELEGAAASAVEAIERRAEGRVPVETAVVQGDPEETILEYAADHGVDLVAMGTHGRTGVERYVVGSVSEQVLRHSTLPVLTARAVETGASPGDYDELLIPTDGSDAAEAVLDHAMAVARAVDARVHAVNVIDLGDVSASSEYAIPNDLIDSLQDRGAEATDAVAARAEEAGLEAVTEVMGGYPARDLLSYAEEEGIDLIAMGTSGRTGLGRFLMGSTTERIVRHSPVPVLSVNARNAD